MAMASAGVLSVGGRQGHKGATLAGAADEIAVETDARQRSSGEARSEN